MTRKLVWIKKVVLVMSGAVLSLTMTNSQQLAFPTAEGFGKYAVGGRGGKVIEVTNLNDSGEGSLRAAIEEKGTRTVVFRVSGTIFLESSLRIKNDSITIAGQTAPGDGITLANYNFNVDADEVILRYIRSRLGDAVNQEADAFTSNDTKNVIIDHCTFSWGVDEVATAYLNENFTMQWCIISESLYESIHTKGEHGYGGIWGGARASFHHNLLSHHSSRLPRFNGARYEGGWPEHVDYRNNVVYNWGFNSSYGGEPSEVDGNKANINMVSNYYKPGPGTNGGAVQYRIVEPYEQGSAGFSNWYIDSNIVAGYPDVFEDNWGLGVQQASNTDKDAMRADVPFEYDITTIHTAEEAYQAVLQNAGAILPRRDTVDKRIAHEVKTGTATYGGVWGENSGIIDTPDDVGGYPVLFSAWAPQDSDHDGMPDDWEISMGLNIDDPADRNGDPDADGYTNLEEFLNSITTFPEFIYPPTNLEAAQENENVMLTWVDNSTLETMFILERQEINGFSVIDTVGADIRHYTDTTAGFEATYQYRLKAISESDSSVYSNIAEITTLSENPLPFITTNPFPEDGATFISSNTTLMWQGNSLTNSYKINLGETTPLSLTAEVTDTFYHAVLDPETTYYWRIDAVNENGTTEGEIWSFVTRPQIAPQLIGHWDFESVFRASDSSSFDNTGQYFNVASGDFEFNAPDGSRTILFKRDAQFVRIPYDYAFDFELGSFSIAFWMKQSVNGLQVAERYPYLGKGHSTESGFALLNKGYEIAYLPDTDQITFKVDDKTSESELIIDQANIINNEWTHVVVQRDTIAKLLRAFVDGVEHATIADNTGDLSGQDPLQIGNFSDTPGYLTWWLDNLKIFNYAISREEIQGIIDNSTTHAAFFTGANVSVYPNPVNKKLYVEFTSETPENLWIELLSMDGKSLYKKQIYNTNTKKQKTEVDVEGIAPGIYLLQLSDSQQSIQKKIIVNN